MNRFFTLAIGLVLFGAGFFLGDSFAPRSEEGSDGRLSYAREPAPNPERIPSGTEPRPFVPPEPGQVEEASVRVERELIADRDIVSSARARLESPSYPRGDGVIEGECRMLNGTPVAQVLVRAYQAPSSKRTSRGTVSRDPSRAPEVDEDLSESFTSLLEKVRRRRTTLVETRTDEQGRYELRGLGPVEYRVEAFAEGFQASLATGSTRDARPGEKVSFVLEPVHEVVIRVLLPDGRLADHADVSVRKSNYGWGGQTYEWTPEEPTLYLTTGRVNIGVNRREEGEPRQFAEGRDVYLGAETPRLELTFQLVERIRIEGTIVPDRPEELSRRSPRVRAVRYEGETPPDLTKDRESGSSARAVVQGDDWKYTFDALEPGSYAFGLYEGSDRAVAQVNHVVVESGEGPRFRLAEEDPGDRLRVRVLDPGGLPLDRVNFRWLYERNDRRHGTQPGWRREEDGTYLVERPKDAQNPQGEATLIVSHGHYGEERRSVRLAHDDELTFHFLGTASLRVDAPSCVGTEVAERVRFQLLEKVGTTSHTVVQTDRGLDAKGGRTMAPLQPGSYVLEVQVDIERWSFRTVRELPVELSPGEQHLQVELPALHELVVEVAPELRENAGQTRLDLYVDEGGEKGTHLTRATLDAEGRVTFSHMLAGTYWLEVDTGSSDVFMTVSVPTSNPVRFAPLQGRARDALKVAIQDEKGALARVGLRSGDLVVGIGNHPFREPTQMQALLRGLLFLTDEPLTFHLLRGGTRTTLSVDPLPLRDTSQWGGKFTPSTR